MSRTCFILLVAAVSAATSLVPALAATPPEVVGIQLVPHEDQEGMGRRGMVSIIAEVEPGTVVQREIIASNDTSEPQQLELYVGGAAINGSEFTPDDDPVHPVTQWSSMSPPQVALDPGERARSRIRIEVPEDAAGAEYYGVVWVQPPASEGPIREVNRVGVRIYLTVSGAGDPTSEAVTDFGVGALAAALLPDGRQQVRASVENLGERAIDVVGELELLAGPGGLRAGPFPTDGVTTLAIGADGQATVTMEGGLPSGPWTARLLLSSGSIERVTEGTITFPDEAGTEEQTSDVDTIDATGLDDDEIAERLRQQRRTLLPIAAFLILLALVLLFLLLWWQRRDEDDEEEPGVPVGVANDDGDRRSEEHPR